PQEMAEEDPELCVDMELLVDTLRSMDPSEIRNPLLPFRPSHASSRGKYAPLPPIDEHQAWRGGCVWRRMDRKGGEEEEDEEEEEEEEEEIENPYLSKDEMPPAKEEPRKVYSWENRSPSGLFSANLLQGTALVTDFQEPKAGPTEDRPYSRLDSSILYGGFISSVLPPLKALEKDREDGKAPGIDQSTGQRPLLLGEAEQKTPSLPASVQPAAGERKSWPRRVSPIRAVLSGRRLCPGSGQAGAGGVSGAVGAGNPCASLSQQASSWVMYEKPRYHGRKCVLAEGDVEISNPWAAYRKDGEAPENTPFRIGSLKRVVRDYRLPEISLFSAENGEGTKVRFTGSSEDTRLCAKPLTASSIIVHSGLWLIYSKPFFDDDPYVLEPGGYPSLKAWGAKDPAVCSLHPITLGCPVVEKPGEPKAVIYELAGFQGHSCEVNQDIYDLNSLGPGMPPVGSLRILGGCWVGYEKEGFRGHQYLLEEGEYPDWQQWGGCSAALGSLRLIRTGGDCGAPPQSQAPPAPGQTHSLRFSPPEPGPRPTGMPANQTARFPDVFGPAPVLAGSQAVQLKDTGPENRPCPSWWGQTRAAGLQGRGEETVSETRLQTGQCPGPGADFTGVQPCMELTKNSPPVAARPRAGERPGARTARRRCVSVASHVAVSLEPRGAGAASRPALAQEPGAVRPPCGQRDAGGRSLASAAQSPPSWGLCEQSNFRGRQWVLDCMEITNWLLYSGLQHVGSLYPIRQRRIHFRIANVGLQLLLCVPEAVEDMRAGRVEVSALAQQSSPVWYYEEGLIKNQQAAPTMSLQVIGQAGKGAKVVLWAESRVPRQAWRIDSFGRIWSQMFEGMILDVKGGRSYDRDHAVLWDVAEERPLQIWDIQVL
uniref:Beta/gamma crystallin 'Greek key' domain-containing protein n=1 Tax=Pelodiscus sinensis TaxID=13735 RepID=K7FUR2_PELSI